MPLATEVKTSYEVVLRDLQAERDVVQQQLDNLHAQLKEINSGISTVSKRLHPDSPSSHSPLSFRPPNQKYANTSVRWAILDLLADSEAMTTAQIAETIKAGGVPTRASNFVNNVSAVLTTTMKEKHKEVQQLPDGRWELTDNGRNAIAHIRTNPKFRRGLSWS